MRPICLRYPNLYSSPAHRLWVVERQVGGQHHVELASAHRLDSEDASGRGSDLPLQLVGGLLCSVS